MNKQYNEKYKKKLRMIKRLIPQEYDIIKALKVIKKGVQKGETFINITLMDMPTADRLRELGFDVDYRGLADHKMFRSDRFLYVVTIR